MTRTDIAPTPRQVAAFSAAMREAFDGLPSMNLSLRWGEANPDGLRRILSGLGAATMTASRIDRQPTAGSMFKPERYATFLGYRTVDPGVYLNLQQALLEHTLHLTGLWMADGQLEPAVVQALRASRLLIERGQAMASGRYRTPESHTAQDHMLFPTDVELAADARYAGVLVNVLGAAAALQAGYTMAERAPFADMIIEAGVLDSAHHVNPGTRYVFGQLMGPKPDGLGWLSADVFSSGLLAAAQS